MAKTLPAQNNKTVTDLTKGPIYSTLLAFSVPILLGSVVTQLYNVADSVIVGKFVSANALASISAASPVMSFINMFLIGLSTGSNVVIAQHVGARDKEGLQKAVRSIACITLLVSAFITIVGALLSRTLLVALDTPKEILQDAATYLIIIYLGTTGNLVYQMGNGALRGMGDSKWPFFLLLFCSVLNVILDLVAVFVFEAGVMGVAIATSLSQLLSGIGVVLRLNSGKYDVKLSLRELRLDPKESGNVVNIGLPAAIQNVGNMVAALLVQSSVNYFGSYFIAANNVVVKVDDLVSIPVMALSTALCTFVGQNMGAGEKERIRKSISFSILSLIGLGILQCGLLVLTRDYFPLLFTDEETVIRYTSEGLFIMSFQFIFLGIDRCLVNAMRGLGRSVVPMITAQFGAFTRIPLAYILGVLTDDYHGIFWALLIAAATRCVAITVYYLLGSWKKPPKKAKKRAVHLSELRKREKAGGASE